MKPGLPKIGPDPGRIGELVKRIVDQMIRADWNTVFARIEEIDQARLRATVKPLVQLPISGGDVREIGPLYNVPVNVDRAGPFYMRRPYQPKDIVLLNIHDVSLERVLLDHEPQDPKLRHVGSLQDAVAHGGYRAESDKFYPPIWTEDWLQQNSDTKDTLVWYKKGGIHWMVPGTDGTYSYRIDAQDIIRLVSYAAEVILNAAQKIQVGEPADYHALLAEPVIDTYNSHVHICPACGAPTTPPVQKMSLEEHASQLVWLRKTIPGPMQMPFIMSLWGEVTPVPPDVVFNPQGLLAALAQAGLQVDLSFVEEALNNAYQCVCKACQAALGELGKHVDAALKEIGKTIDEAVKYVTDKVVNTLADKFMKDPLGFLSRLFTDPVGLAAEIVADVTSQIISDVTGIDVEGLVNEAIEAAKRWALNAISDAVEAGLSALGLEGAAQVVNAIQTGINVAAETGSWAQGVAAGINALGGEQAATVSYLTGTILGAVEAATAT